MAIGRQVLLIRKQPLWIAIAALLCLGCVLPPSAPAQDSGEDDFKPGPGAGKMVFNSTCAGCHGLDGRGSEKAPNIVSSAKVQHLSDAQISNIVSNGIPGTGMPAFPSLTGVQLRAVVGYLHALQGRGDAAAISGNPVRGRNLFFGKGECSSCHTVLGEGGFIGPDLTRYGGELTPRAIRNGIVNSNRIVPSGYRLAAATTHEGNRIEGVVRSEDNFSVQLQGRDGAFHFLQKSDLQNLEYLDQPLMPLDYGKRLSEAELDDLVKYLANPGSSEPKTATKTHSSGSTGERSE
jgi:putative heme-binding domain-containing protein